MNSLFVSPPVHPNICRREGKKTAAILWINNTVHFKHWNTEMHMWNMRFPWASVTFTEHPRQSCTDERIPGSRIKHSGTSPGSDNKAEHYLNNDLNSLSVLSMPRSPSMCYGSQQGKYPSNKLFLVQCRSVSWKTQVEVWRDEDTNRCFYLPNFPLLL